jgi:sugar phosphate isomerase/epimerase
MTNWCPVLCSTGAFTRVPHLTDHRAILRYGPGLPADGLEVMFHLGWYAQVERVTDDLLTTGLKFPAVHAEKSTGTAMGSADASERATGLERLQVNCQFANQIGAKLVVLHLWGLPGSDEHIERNLATLGPCLDIAEEAGVQLAVETIPCARADPLTHIRRAMEQDARCMIALDTEFLAQHQQLEEALTAAWLWKDGRVRHVHIKDYDGQAATPDGYRRYLHPGEGHIDFARFFAALQNQGFDGAISLEASVVNQDNSIDVEKLKKSMNRLKTLVG